MESLSCFSEEVRIIIYFGIVPVFVRFKPGEVALLGNQLQGIEVGG
jgi:hypothetical protein